MENYDLSNGNQFKMIQNGFMIYMSIYWLVVGPPLWKIWVRHLGWLATQY